MLHRRCRRGLWRWAMLATVGLLLSMPLHAQLVAAPETRAFSHRWLVDYARKLSTQAYTPNEMASDNPLRSLSYDDYRRIVFNPDDAVWSDGNRPFQLQLFHPGYLHTTPVDIHQVSEGVARRLAFTTDVFNYHDSPVNIDQVDVQGYAGFRVHHPINTPERYEEFLVFLGASYFRAVGKDQFYGLSARGLAVNTIGPGGEEFPRFSAFWIERPAADDERIVIHALLDSPSVTGAYRFVASPGERTLIDVDARLYPRRDMASVGIAPLTSMFLFNDTNRAAFDDFRGAVHDSDGLKIQQANGETVWRPLSNPRELQVSSFGATATPPDGFGLLQRRRDFDRFNDNEARYDKRPSLWVEPVGDWGKGRVELVEIPTQVEYEDNIVAYWRPATGFQAGEAYSFRYRMHWGSPLATGPGQVVNTATGNVGAQRLFVIDYSDGERIPNLSSDPQAVRINATTSAGTISDVRGAFVEATGDYRVWVKLAPGEATLVELRVTLAVDGSQWGETWLYRWTQ